MRRLVCIESCKPIIKSKPCERCNFNEHDFEPQRPTHRTPCETCNKNCLKTFVCKQCKFVTCYFCRKAVRQQFAEEKYSHENIPIYKGLKGSYNDNYDSYIEGKSMIQE